MGITSPGGKAYSPFLDHYLNIPNWLTYLIAKSAMGLLKLLGFAAYQHAPNNVRIENGGGVNILWACLGFGVMSFWVAFITAHRAAWKYKLKWCVIGISIIIALNIIRIMMIALAYHFKWKMIMLLDAHQTFNIASYMLLFVLVFWFIVKYKKYEVIQAY